MDDGLSNLQTLAEQTDGIAVLNTNDLRTGMTKIANDLSSHYVLGYYTNNTKWDGGTRKITVRLKGTGKAIRARREYRAPTEEDMAALRSATAAAAAPAGPSAPQVALERAVAGQPVVAAERVRHGHRQRSRDRGGDRGGGNRRRPIQAGRGRRGAAFRRRTAASRSRSREKSIRVRAAR